MHWVKTVGAVAVGLVVLVVFYNFAINEIDPGLYFDPKESGGAVKALPVGRILSAAAAMVIGIAFGSIYDQVQQRQSIESYRRELSVLFHSTRFLRAFLAAPIVFVGVYLAAKTEPDAIVSLIFAFQNGFFCDAVMRSKEPKVAA